jgi:hypothetical protein
MSALSRQTHSTRSLILDLCRSIRRIAKISPENLLITAELEEMEQTRARLAAKRDDRAASTTR